ncbi:hypothetical protein I5W21_11035 [Stenotrophomonas maltophilia]|jgi:hypothetical protein|nr:DUF6602 domain-containing protein [Stenotrophomonas maltophilia]MBC9116853.1 hypothetical protein [Stenotrophomonas maltophilia]MBH1385370.1 hypothetical protein [Stenotrophomonas maltophilia]MBH1840180.1 hypothetical protein [Stenotrophomonas maltophilia]MBN5106137.1 hypothetical protein [Stenotrophomonas maltophilia]MCF3499724.1 hypothetical protein [Stenotrophomonas maltophilia]
MNSLHPALDMGTSKAPPYLQYCRSALKSLVSQYEMSKVIGHSATAGTVRERLIHDFLESHIPEMTSAVSGVIIDSQGRRSRQQDIVLMLKSMPRLRFNSGHDLIFHEGVVATIEVKTSVTTSVLLGISENIASVKCLEPTSFGGTKLGVLDWPMHRILHCVVGYGGSSLHDISNALTSFPEAKKPDIYLDLTKGMLLRNEGIFSERTLGDDYLIFDDPGEGLARFLSAMTVVTSSYSVRDVKWEQYLLDSSVEERDP